MGTKVLSLKPAYKCSWIEIHKAKIKLPNGVIAEWQKVVIPDFVAIVAVDKKKNIYLSKEWRVSWGKDILHLPAGSLDGKRGERQILQQARNELREEIGLDAKKWQKLIFIQHNARIKLSVHLYLATDLFPSKKKADDDEIIKMVKMPFQKAYRLFKSGKIMTTSYTLLGMMLAKERLRI